MILDKAIGWIVIFTQVIVNNLIFWNLNECHIWNDVSDLESSETELCPVIRKTA